MNLKINEPKLGECNIISYQSINKDSQYLIKALSALILLCMNSEENPKKHEKLADILKETSIKANELFNEDIQEANFHATELFD